MGYLISGVMWLLAIFFALASLSAWTAAAYDDLRGGYGSERPVFNWRGKDAAFGIIFMAIALILAHFA